MYLPNHRRICRAVAVSAAAAVLLAACSGGSDDAPAEKSASATTTAAPTTSPAPTLSPAEAAVAPLLDREAVDLATLPLPKPSGGGSPAAWDTSALIVRALAVASQDEGLWTTKPGTGAIAKVAAAAPPQVTKSMNDFDTAKKEPPVSLFWASTFADGFRPSAAKVVDARWASTPSTDGSGLPIVIIEATTLYTFETASPVLVQRRFTIAVERPVPDLGAFHWSVDVETGGADDCRMWTEGVIAPKEDADTARVQALVDHVVDQTKVETRVDEDDDVPTLRKEACA